MTIVSIENLSKQFTHEHGNISALEDVSLSINKGESLSICGSSGAGKSTLLNLIGGLDEPTSGKVKIKKKCLSQMSEKEQAAFRNRTLGFIFQFHHLLHDFTIVENVMMPLLIQKASRKLARQSAEKLLERVGIADTADRLPQELSGGEQQRAAIARAVVHKPKLILADEPTGNLDEKNGGIVFDLLCELNRDLGATLVIVTHNQKFARRMENILVLEKGKVKSFSRHD